MGAETSGAHRGSEADDVLAASSPGRDAHGEETRAQENQAHRCGNRFLGSGLARGYVDQRLAAIRGEALDMHPDPKGAAVQRVDDVIHTLSGPEVEPDAEELIGI